MEPVPEFLPKICVRIFKSAGSDFSDRRLAQTLGLIPGMYGPPRDHKVRLGEKMSLRQCIRPLMEPLAPGRMSSAACLTLQIGPSLLPPSSASGEGYSAGPCHQSPYRNLGRVPRRCQAVKVDTSAVIWNVNLSPVNDRRVELIEQKRNALRLRDVGLAYVNGSHYLTGGRDVSYYQFFATHYCGPGGAGEPNGTLDKACKTHDECFETLD